MDRPFSLVAAHDLIPERAERLASECGCRPHPSFESLLADPSVDLVVIATRSDAHAAMAEAALRAGKHVVVEKPMGISLAETDRLLATAREVAARGAVAPKLLVRLSKRFDPAFRLVCDTLAAGQVGRPHGLQIRIGEFVPRSDWQTLRRCGGGQLLNWGPHVFDWALQLLGGSAEVLCCDLRRVAAGGDAEDHVKVLLRGRNDLLADVEISGGNAAHQPLFVLQGDRGALTVYPDHAQLRQLKQPLNRQRLSATEVPPPQEDRSHKSLGPECWTVQDLPMDPAGGEGRFWEAVYDHLVHGAALPITLDEAREVMRIIEVSRELGMPGFMAREQGTI